MICKRCGTEFNAQYHRRKYCDECKKLPRDILSGKIHDPGYPQTCVGCGVVFYGKKRKYCTVDCQKQDTLNRAKQKRKERERTAYNKVCPSCGKEFTTTNKNKICCGKKCTRKIQSKKRIGKNKPRKRFEKICPRCGVRFMTAHVEQIYHNKSCSVLARFDGKERKAKSEPFVPEQRQCEACNQTYTAGRKDQKYCQSDECIKQRDCDKARDKAMAQHIKKTKPRPCKECGTVFTPEYGAKIRAYCTPECSRKHGRRLHKQKRRAMFRDAFVENVPYREIYERDHGICQLCGKRVYKRKKAPDLMAGSIDHIIPLALGGTHEMKNVQLAHCICNSLKGVKAMHEQLRLC